MTKSKRKKKEMILRELNRLTRINYPDTWEELKNEAEVVTSMKGVMEGIEKVFKHYDKGAKTWRDFERLLKRSKGIIFGISEFDGFRVERGTMTFYSRTYRGSSAEGRTSTRLLLGSRDGGIYDFNYDFIFYTVTCDFLTEFKRYYIE